MVIIHSLYEKPYFLFPNVLEKMVFPKKPCWNMIFLVLSGKMIFVFLENMILFFRLKMKDGLSQKKPPGNMTFSSNVPKRWSFHKKSHWNKIFLVLSGKMVFFCGKYNIFSLGGKWKMIFLKKYMEIGYFLYICINVTNMILPFRQKNQRWSSPEKKNT